MADGDAGAAGGHAEFVEGYWRDGREGMPLEKITKPKDLQAFQLQIKREEVEVNKELQAERSRIMDVQGRLDTCNIQLARESEELDLLRSEQRVTLDADQKQHIVAITRDTIDRLVQLRTRREDEEMEIDVHFQPGDDTAGVNLYVGDGGAGSRDATFLVQLSQQVSSLATQAAKYWGLDPSKVFFLDRDGRIVPESMRLSDIILPPVPHSSQPYGGPGASAGASSSAALLARADVRSRSSASSTTGTMLEYGAAGMSGGAGDPHRMDVFIKGRNYSLKLVRAGTVLSKENLNRPKGEKWDDFTFSAGQLNRDLEATRKKHGESDFGAERVSMDEIPSLYNLIQDCQKKKMRKRADTRCRIAEFVIFLVCVILFHILIAPQSEFLTSMQLVSKGIRWDLTTFTNSESTVLGVDNFDQITDREEYKGWLLGPLRRKVEPAGMGHRNLWVIGVVGYVYDADDLEPPNTPRTDPDKDWCPSNSSVARLRRLSDTSNATGNETVSTSDCVPTRLKTCVNRRVIAVYDQAIRDGKVVPRCKQIHTKSNLVAYMGSHSKGRELSFMKGSVSSYSGGARVEVMFRNDSEYLASIAPLLPNPSDVANPAKLVIVFVYSPDLNGVMAFQMLMEDTGAGTLKTAVRQQIVHLESPSVHRPIIYTFTILLACACFMMEVRRIMGCPKRFTFEDKRDRCSVWTLIFFLLPLTVFVSFVLFMVRTAGGADDIAELDAQSGLTQEAITALYDRSVLEYYNLALNLVVLIMFNLLFLRYLLMYFPQLAFVTEMVRKLVKPLFCTCMFIAIYFVVAGFFLYAMYSSRFKEFRNLTVIALEVVRFAQGGFDGWYDIYKVSPAVWTISMFITFLFLTLLLQNLVVAIMLSHKKEKDLLENYSYHPFWASERSRGNRDPKEFNPATVGWDFSSPEPHDLSLTARAQAAQ